MLLQVLGFIAPFAILKQAYSMIQCIQASVSNHCFCTTNTQLRKITFLSLASSSQMVKVWHA